MKRAEKFEKLFSYAFSFVSFLEFHKIGNKNENNKTKLTRIMKALIRDSKEQKKVCNDVLSCHLKTFQFCLPF